MAVKGMSVFTHQGEDYTVNDPNNAPEFDATLANGKDEYVYYQGDLYRFDAAHTANTAWSSRSKTKVKLGAELLTVKNAENSLNSKVSSLDNNLYSNYPAFGDLIKQIVSSETAVTLTTEQTQAVYDVDSGLVSKDGWLVKRWSVTPGTVYHVIAENYNSEADDILFFFDSSFNLLWYTDNADDLYVVAPDGTAFAFANRNWINSPEVQVYSCTSNKNTVNELKGRYDYIYSALLTSEEDITEEFTKILQVYADIDSTGRSILLVAADGGSYYQKLVSPYEKYHIDAEPDTGYKTYIVTDSGNHILATGDASGDIVIPYGGVLLTVNNNWRNYTPTIRKDAPGIIKVNTITVKQNGGDFTTVKDAVESITDSSYENRYNIEIHDGTYNIYNEFGGDTWFEGLDDPSNNMNGLYLPNYVNLIGVGDVTLTMRCADAYATSTNVPLVSLLNLTQNNEIKNIKFYAKNVRYVVHDEANNQYHHINRLFENCYFEHEGNKEGTWYAMYALGCGSGNGNHYVYKQCVFKDIVPPYLMHNNVNQSEPTILEFYGCKFIDTVQSSSVYLSALSGSVAKCYAYFYDCQISGGINTAGTKWYIRGGGSTPFPHWNTDTTDETVYFEMSDETTVCKAAAAITRLQAVMLTGMSGVTPLTAGSENRFYGIALNDASSGDEVVVQYAGYVDINASSISANNGDAAYITGDDIGIGTGTKAIGYVVKEGDCFSIRLQ